MKLWLEIANSDWQDHLGKRPPADRLDDPAWLANLAASANVPQPAGMRKSPAEMLKKLRQTIRNLIEKRLAGKRLSGTDLGPLNEVLCSDPVKAVLVPTSDTIQLKLQGPASSDKALVFAVAASFADFLVHGDPSRLRACENPTCRWIFLDPTRSRTGRWCGKTCRSLIKVRELRNRQRKSTKPPRPFK